MTPEDLKKLVQFARTRDLMRYATIGLASELAGMSQAEQAAVIADLRAQRKFMEARRWEKRHKNDAVPPSVSAVFNDLNRSSDAH